MVDIVAKLLKGSPFRPFTITTSSGENFHVPHPEHAHLSPRGTRVTVYDDHETVSILTALHIVAIKEDLSADRSEAD